MRHPVQVEKETSFLIVLKTGMQRIVFPNRRTVSGRACDIVSRMSRYAPQSCITISKVIYPLGNTPA